VAKAASVKVQRIGRHICAPIGMSVAIILVVVRRTITLPEDIDSRVRAAAGDGESFSAAVARLIDAGLTNEQPRLAWIGSGDSGDPELAYRVEGVLKELAANADLDD
jgi:hypothetical protein